MIRKPRKSVKERGPVVSRLSWLVTTVIVVVGIGFGSREALTRWIVPDYDVPVDGNLRDGDVSAGSMLAERLGAGQSDHLTFGITEQPDTGQASRSLSLEGRWIADGQQHRPSIAEDSECRYQVRSMDLRLKEVEGRVYGYGSYSLTVHDCSSRTKEITEYVAITGVYERPNMLLSMTNTMTGRIDLEYHGTVHSGGITGEVRSPDGELRFSEVSLEQA